jgi:hypothetical protein
VRHLRNIGTANLVLAGVGVVVIVAVFLWTAGIIGPSSPDLALTAIALTPSPGLFTPSPSATPTATPTPVWPGSAGTEGIASPTSGPVVSPILPELPAITPPPGGQVVNLTPAAEAVGWMRAGDTSANHLGDYNIYAGVFDGQTHLGAIQFDLSQIPPGVAIAYADLTLVGLTEQWLAGEGTWQVDLLASWLDGDWARRTYTDLLSVESSAAQLEPALTARDLGTGRANHFVFSPQARDLLQARTFTGKVSFRITGPAAGSNDLFAWDSGYGTGSQGWKPVLRIAAGPAPAVAPASPTPDYVIVTTTPTPANVVTAAAIAATATAQATTTGTPAPLPLNWVTPFVVVPTATPANTATAQWHAALATAQASLYGTPTPLPPNAWTATPAPTPFVITNTPTPRTWSAAIAQAEAEATRRATAGPPTAFPPNWVTVTPVPPTRVVASTPAPENGATAQAARAQATIVALTTGTYTPVPWIYVTPTPLPLLIPVERITPTPIPAATPQTPKFLKGKIAFLSDRYGGPMVFVMDPDGSHVALLTQDYPYLAALLREPFAADGRRRAFVQPNDRGVPQIFGSDPLYDATWAITAMTGMAYAPAWSPVSDRILFVATEAGNDEIYAIDADGTDLTRLTANTWEWDKHPSWSADGRRIVFYSNRDTARRQIWIMDANGGDLRNISSNKYDDWDPVWIK